MEILKATAYFGKLNGQTIEFTKGLNAIVLPNEGGKSTWCAFIKAMLYGFATKERSTQTALAEKDRFRPWDKERASGTMTVCYHGRTLVLERTFTKTGRTSSFSAYFEDTGEKADFLTADTCGEILCGVSREAFEKSCFISGTNMQTGKSAELEKKIQALASTGDEEVAFSEVSERLNRYRKDIYVDRVRGALAKTRMEAESLSQKIQQVRSLNTRQTALHAKLLESESAIQRLEQEIEWINAYAYKDREDELERAEQECGTIEKIYQECRRGLLHEGKELTSAEVQYLTDTAAAWREQQALSAQAKRLYQELAEAADIKQAEAPQEPETPGRGAGVCLILGVLALLSGGILAWITKRALLGLLGLFSGGILLGAYVLCRKKNADKKRKWEMEALRIRQQNEQYAEQSRQMQKRKLEADEKERAAAETMQSLQAACAQNGIPFSGDVQAFAAVLSGLRAEIEHCGRLQSQLLVAKSRRDALRQALPEKKGEVPQGVPRPMGSLEEKEERLREMQHSCAVLRHEIDSNHGRMMEMGEFAVLSAQMEALQQREASLEQCYRAVQTAQQTLEEAFDEMNRRVAPALCAKAETYFNGLTRGKYHKLIIREGFSEILAAEPEGHMHSALWLSEGTANQVYLALRLAICDLVILDGGAPLILDDALITFDDARAQSAVEMLREMQGKRQILLFSCHEREKMLALGAN